MSLVSALLREDLRSFAGYRSARSEPVEGEIWLNANEAAHPNPVDDDGCLRRYPQPQPHALRAAMASLYGCAPDQLLIGRGSDEPIDLLVRAFCMPGRDGVLVTPPVFGMYATCARLQGARVIEVPIRDGPDDFRLDLDEVARAASAQRVRLVFLCSPGNPAGGLIPAASILALARTLHGKALVVVDEAYIEFADAPSLVPCVASLPNLAVLRTLSKAHALAGARVGCLVADPEIVSVLRRCQAPYPVPAPCAALALKALSTDVLRHTALNTSTTCIERETLRLAIARSPGVRRVYPSRGNFLLVRFLDAQAALERFRDANIVVRDMRHMPQLHDALRITVGNAEHNAQALRALQARESA